MKIIRNGQEFDLTSEELRQAYEEKQKEYYINDIGSQIIGSQIREDYDIDLGELARRFDRALSKNDGYLDSYWCTMEYVIEEYLKEKETE